MTVPPSTRQHSPSPFAKTLASASTHTRQAAPVRGGEWASVCVPPGESHSPKESLASGSDKWPPAHADLPTLDELERLSQATEPPAPPADLPDDSREGRLRRLLGISGIQTAADLPRKATP